MRYLLSILLFLSVAASGQVFQTNNSPFKFRGLKGDSMVVIPFGADTTILVNPKWGESMNGALFFKYSDSSLWGKYQNRWRRIGGSGGGTYTASNGITLSGSDFKLGGDLTQNTTINGDEIYGLTLTKLTDLTIGIPSKGAGKVLTSDVDGGATWQTPTVTDTTGLGSLYIRNQQAVQEDKRLRIKSAFFDSLSASGSGGLNLYSNNGTQVANYGGGGGSNATYYGGVNIDGTTRLATSLTGILKATSGTVATAVSGTDFKTINNASILGSGDIVLPVIDSLAFRRYGTAARNIRSFNAGGLSAAQSVVNQSSSTADSSNVLMGYLSGRDLTSGYRNYFAGDLAGLTATTAHTNVVMGYRAYGNTNVKTGNSNVAIGTSALENASSAGGVVAIGPQAGSSITTAGSTISIGNRAATNITTGSGNVVVANYSNSNQMTALSANNTHMGSGTAAVSAALNNTAFFGADAGDGASGNNNSGFGRNSLINATGANNVGIGYHTGTNGGASTLSGNNNTLLGSGAKPISYSADNQFTVWAGASTATGIGGGSGGYNVLSRNSSGQWIFNQTTSEVTSIASGAAVEINGTTGGFLMPRMTASQRGAISSPATGLQVFDTDSVSIMVYNGTAWKPLDKSDFVEAVQGSDVSMPTLSTWYSGPAITLPAGTWVINAQITMTNATGLARYVARIFNGTASVSSGNANVPNAGNRPGSIALHRIVTITSNTTYTLQGLASVNNATIVQNSDFDTQAGATIISAHKIR